MGFKGEAKHEMINLLVLLLVYMNTMRLMCTRRCDVKTTQRVMKNALTSAGEHGHEHVYISCVGRLKAVGSRQHNMAAPMTLQVETVKETYFIFGGIINSGL